MLKRPERGMHTHHVHQQRKTLEFQVRGMACESTSTFAEGSMMVSLTGIGTYSRKRWTLMSGKNERISVLSVHPNWVGEKVAHASTKCWEGVGDPTYHDSKRAQNFTKYLDG